jgi:4-diphosphocytidyl-2-C-methyl-D-erythritol kinase
MLAPIVGKPGDEEGAVEGFDARDSEAQAALGALRLAADESASSPCCAKEFVLAGVVHGGRLGATAVEIGDRHREVGKGVHEVRGAVEGIDVPAGTVARGVGVVLLGHDGIAGEGRANAFDDDVLGAAVHVGDQVDRGFVLHAASDTEGLADEISGPAREFAGEIGAVGHAALLSRVPETVKLPAFVPSLRSKAVSAPRRSATGASPQSFVRSVVVRAPAKVNLSLRITGRRPDGYHELDSLMFAISLADVLQVTSCPAAKATVACTVSGPEKVPGGSTNLAARAAAAVLEKLGVTARVSIRLRKEIPFGAGLGGGSSDAAAILRVLPGLLGRRLPSGEAHAIAARLGADVPFFLDGRPARATGIGERLSPLPAAPAGAMVVVVPEQRVNTAWAYRNALPRLTSGLSTSRVRPFPRCIDAVETWFFNDFQRGVEKAVPAVRRTREGLEALGARAVVMSGSGSAVVGWFADLASARAAADAWHSPGRVFVAKTLRRAPRPERAGEAGRTTRG